MHRPLRLTIDRAALQSPTGAGSRERAGDGVRRGDQGRRLWARRARDARRLARGRLPRLLRLDLGGSGGAWPGARRREPGRAPRRRARRCRSRARQHARPVLNTRRAGRALEGDRAGRPCDVMVDTGMNRLGLRPDEIAAARRPGDRHAAQPSGLRRRGSCAERASSSSASAIVAAAVPAQRYSLANSAGICLGRDYSFDLVRPGLALYGGIPRARRRATSARSRSLRRRSSSGGTIRAGESCGYGATFIAEPTPRRRSSTSAMPTAICAASRTQGTRASAAEYACRCSAACRWTWSRRLRRRAGPQRRRWVEIDYDLPRRRRRVRPVAI